MNWKQICYTRNFCTSWNKCNNSCSSGGEYVRGFLVNIFLRGCMFYFFFIGVTSLMTKHILFWPIHPLLLLRLTSCEIMMMMMLMLVMVLSSYELLNKREKIYSRRNILMNAYLAVEKGFSHFYFLLAKNCKNVLLFWQRRYYSIQLQVGFVILQHVTFLITKS